MSAATTAQSRDRAHRRGTRRKPRADTSSPHRSRAHARMTSRGVGVLAVGILMVALGVGLATPILVYTGISATGAVVVAWAWVLIAVNSLVRTHTRVHRHVAPHPLTAGALGQATVTLGVSGGTGRGALMRRAAVSHVDLREQAAAELTGASGTKAAVERDRGTLTLRYGLAPVTRGRWPLGPVLLHNSDPFGMILADTPVGTVQQVPVWPAIVDLSGTAGALMGHADRVVLGARTPSADDASLREYREGDDLRRVHWPSTARRGTMVVRSDERAGRRPATVILDVPRDDDAREHAITLAASVGVSVLSSGHPVRLVGAGLDPEATQHLGERGSEAARVQLLNQTLDLHSPASRAAGTADLVRAARLVADDARHGEVTVAILDPVEDQALEALVPIAHAGRAWAIVRTDAHSEDEAQQSVAALRKAGWRVTTTHAGDDVAQVWTRMLSTGDIG